MDRRLLLKVDCRPCAVGKQPSIPRLIMEKKDNEILNGNAQCTSLLVKNDCGQNQNPKPIQFKFTDSLSSIIIDAEYQGTLIFSGCDTIEILIFITPNFSTNKTRMFYYFVTFHYWSSENLFCCASLFQGRHRQR